MPVRHNGGVKRGGEADRPTVDGRSVNRDDPAGGADGFPAESQNPLDNEKPVFGFENDDGASARGSSRPNCHDGVARE